MSPYLYSYTTIICWSKRLSFGKCLESGDWSPLPIGRGPNIARYLFPRKQPRSVFFPRTYLVRLVQIFFYYVGWHDMGQFSTSSVCNRLWGPLDASSYLWLFCYVKRHELCNYTNNTIIKLILELSTCKHILVRHFFAFSNLHAVNNIVVKTLLPIYC
jgi:hypothetical protein